MAVYVYYLQGVTVTESWPTSEIVGGSTALEDNDDFTYARVKVGRAGSDVVTDAILGTMPTLAYEGTIDYWYLTFAGVRADGYLNGAALDPDPPFNDYSLGVRLLAPSDTVVYESNGNLNWTPRLANVDDFGTYHNHFGTSFPGTYEPGMAWLAAMSGGEIRIEPYLAPPASGGDDWDTVGDDAYLVMDLSQFEIGIVTLGSDPDPEPEPEPVVSGLVMARGRFFEGR